MQVQQPMQSSMYNSHPHPHSGDQNTHIHSNGAHSDSRQYYSAPTNGHSEQDDMNPYQNNPYHFGQPHGHPQQPPQHLQQQQQQQRQYQANQLPPLQYGGVSVPPVMPPPPAPSAVNYGAPPLQPAPSSSQQVERSQETGPKSMSGNNGKYKFELRVEQQPQRARMCGFGDKDRRPITPPPCIRLVITDINTGQLISPDDIDGMFFVLQVDLWDDNATREVNIVRSSSASPAVSISTATTTSYPPTPDRPLAPEYHHPPMYPSSDGQPMYGAPGYGMAMARPPQPGMQGGYGNPAMGYYAPQYGMQPQPYVPITPAPVAAASTNHSMFTRNLIGSLTVNASCLKDPDGNLGYWFVLQDLSVRTEGHFR
jgi:hypothetical protein